MIRKYQQLDGYSNKKSEATKKLKKLHLEKGLTSPFRKDERNVWYCQFDTDKVNFNEIEEFLPDVISEDDIADLKNYYYPLVLSIKDLIDKTNNKISADKQQVCITGNVYSVYRKNSTVLEIIPEFNDINEKDHYSRIKVFPEKNDDTAANIDYSKKISVTGKININQGMVSIKATRPLEISDSDYLKYLKRCDEELQKGLQNGSIKKQEPIDKPIKQIKLITTMPNNAQGAEDFKNKLKNIGITVEDKDVSYIPWSKSDDIIDCIKEADKEPCYDAICLIRGGGNQYDLMNLNDYKLALAMSKSKTPIITGIGHSDDKFTWENIPAICAPTPTDAADKIISLNKEREPRQEALYKKNYKTNEKTAPTMKDLENEISRLKNVLESKDNKIKELKQKIEQLNSSGLYS